MKYRFLIILFSLLASTTFGQEDELDDVVFTGGIFSLHLGAWHPIGNLSTNTITSPYVGFRFGLPYLIKFKFEFGFNIHIPIGNRPSFPFHIDQQTYDVKFSAGCGNFGIWNSHTNQIFKEFYMDKTIGIGLGALSTNKKRPEDEFHLATETLFINPGITLRKGYKQGGQIGLHIEASYTPFRLFQKHVDKGFGNFSIYTGLVYKF